MTPSITTEALASEPLFWLWLLVAVAQTVAFSIVGTWHVSRIVSKIRDEIQNERKEIDYSLGLLENEFRKSIENTLKETTSVMEALRDRLHDHEIYVRDNFARRDSFYQAINEVKEMIRLGLDRIEQRLNNPGN